MSYPYPEKGSHCSYCGAWFRETKYPKKCSICEKVTYSNPLPVSVALLRAYIEETDETGIIIIQRNIEPHEGEWALPGGYLETGETWQEGSVREVAEEVGVRLNPEDIELYSVVTSTNGNLLVFSSCRRILNWSEINFHPNNEVKSIDLCFLPTNLAFPTHTEHMGRYIKDVLGR